MKHLLLSLLAVWTVSAFCAEKAVPLTRAFVYQGRHYRTSMAPAGQFYRCTFGTQTVFHSVVLHGSYVKKENYDDRMGQNRTKNAKATLEKTGENSFRIISSGILFNAKYPEAAEYTQTTEFHPDRFTISCQVTQKVPMAARSYIFRSIINISPAALVDRGIVASEENKKETILPVPPVCERNKGIMKGGLKQLGISFDPGVLFVDAGNATSLCAMDCRSWGENNFRLDAAPVSVWKQVPELHPAGKRWSWSITFRFRKHDD